MTKNQIKGKIYSHGIKLETIFQIGFDEINAEALAKSVHRLEREAHRLAERECNEQLPSIIKRLDALLNFKKLGIPVFLNGDPRGYALKVEDQYVKDNNLDIEKDWGGYGILAPDFK